VNDIMSTLHSNALIGFHSDVFERINLLSSLRYEGAEVVATIAFVESAERETFPLNLAFEFPVPFSEALWARKMLALCTKEVTIVATPEAMIGLASRSQVEAKARPAIELLGRNTWRLRHGDVVLMETTLGTPSLPAPPLSKAKFEETLRRVLAATEFDLEALWALVEAAVKASHGTMLLITPTATDEAARLKGGGYSDYASCARASDSSSSHTDRWCRPRRSIRRVSCSRGHPRRDCGWDGRARPGSEIQFGTPLHAQEWKCRGCRRFVSVRRNAYVASG